MLCSICGKDICCKNCFYFNKKDKYCKDDDRFVENPKSSRCRLFKCLCDNELNNV